MQPSEAEIVRHCEDCDLGTVDFACPACGRGQSDYQALWYGRDAMYDGASVPTACEHCKAVLLGWWDSKECEFKVGVAAHLPTNKTETPCES